MYDRRFMFMAKALSAAIAVTTEVFIFYYLFLQFAKVQCGAQPSPLWWDDIIFYSVIVSLSAWVHKLIDIVVELGDRLEQKGETVWKRHNYISKEERSNGRN